MEPRIIVSGETESEREVRARDLAYEKGRDDAITTAKFAEQDRRLAAINGSIDKMYEALRALEERVASIERAEQRRDTISETTQSLIQTQSQQAITKRTFGLGVLGVIAAVGGLFIAANPPT